MLYAGEVHGTSLSNGYTQYLTLGAPGIESTKNSFRNQSLLPFTPILQKKNSLVKMCLPVRFEELWENAKPDTRPPTFA
jgi:hypothetical protein